MLGWVHGPINGLSAGGLFSCLSLLECSVLTWHPAGDVLVTCTDGGWHSSSQGFFRSLLATGTVSQPTVDMFLPIQSDMYYNFTIVQ